MNEQELKEIEARAEAATPGPWEQEIDWRYEQVFTLSWACGPETTAQNDEKSQSIKDADFIAHARQDVPALVAEVRRLRAAIEESIQDVKGAQFTDNTWSEARAEQQGILVGLKNALKGGEG